MLDRIGAGLGGFDRIKAVGGDWQTQAMGFVDDDLGQFERQEFIELDDVAVELLFPLHRVARLLRRRDGDVAARRSRAEGIMLVEWTADAAAAHPDSWPADFPGPRPLLLRAAPGTILVELDLRTGRDAEMQIELAVEILQVPMTVDEARQNGLAADVDHLRAGRNGKLTAAADGFKSASLNDNDGIVDRWPSGAIDQPAALQHEHCLGHIFQSPYRRYFSLGTKIAVTLSM